MALACPLLWFQLSPPGLLSTPPAPDTQGTFCLLPKSILSNFPFKQTNSLMGPGCQWDTAYLLSSLALSFLDLYSSNPLLSDLDCGIVFGYPWLKPVIQGSDEARTLLRVIKCQQKVPALSLPPV